MAATRLAIVFRLVAPMTTAVLVPVVTPLLSNSKVVRTTGSFAVMPNTLALTTLMKLVIVA